MERKIGEIFDYNRRRLQVVEQNEINVQDICKDCYFNDNGICSPIDPYKTGLCCSRDDQKEVIFKEVK